MTNFENGINGATGDYLFPIRPSKTTADIARQTSIDKSHLNDLKDRNRALRQQTKAPAAWVDPANLANAGWGVIFAETYTGYTLDALKSDDGLGQLLRHRQQQATQQVETYYRECIYRSGQSKKDFLKAHQAPLSGAVDPDRGMPYYLLIVGDPITIPYEFQYQLDVQYAVGRLYFDQLEDYAYYAQSVIRAEQGQAQRPRHISLWGARNRNDKATRLSADKLVQPLSDWLTSGKAPGWDCPTHLATEATKANLHQQLNGDSAPAVLFTASHGVGYPSDDPHQKDFQGALVCQEWNPFSGQPDPETQLFSAADIQSDANFHGLIAFHFACYGLGTPQHNNFAHRDGEKALAEAPFVARLPQKLLSHPKGGALAVIGHVDRAFSDSFQVAKIQQLAVFQSVLKCLIDQRPVGYAMEFFDQQYAELAADCNLGIRNGDVSDADLSALWTGSTNARNYAIFGDPAVTVAATSSVSTESRKPLGAKVWFQPSGIASAKVTDQASLTPQLLRQLETQIKTLEKENADLKAEVAALREKISTFEAGQ
ncbi:MAG: C25 family cysteine peptidase [Cyanobacteria bacterium P01_C01_bin.120]